MNLFGKTDEEIRTYSEGAAREIIDRLTGKIDESHILGQIISDIKYTGTTIEGECSRVNEILSLPNK